MDNNNIPQVRMVSGLERDSRFDEVMSDLGLSAEGAARAIQLARATRAEHGERVKERPYMLGFIDALSLAATLKRQADVEASRESYTTRIEQLEAQLTTLYRERAGRLDAGSCWCSQCGRNTVNAEQGYDTCGPCLAELRGARA